MEEDHGMEEQHQDMDQRLKLRPDLWKTLPQDLIDKIIDKVLVDLPFSRIFGFCCVCQRWKDFVLSTHSRYILCFHKDSCMMFNAKRGLWESMSLQFCEAEGLRLQDMQRVSCGGGLLFFASDRDDFLVCNPLTRCCKRFKGPMGRLLYDAQCRTRMIAVTTWRVVFRHFSELSSLRSRYMLAVKVIVYSGTEYFHLILGEVYRNSNVATLVKDSRCGSWKTIDGTPKGFRFVVEPTLVSKGSIILGFAACLGGTFKVLNYDLERKRCAWILNVQAFRSVSVATSNLRKILIATLSPALSDDRQLEFLEVGDAEDILKLASSPFPPPTKGPCYSNAISKIQQNLTALSSAESSEVFNIVRLGHGDIVHYISMLKRLPSRQIEISVWTHNQVDSSEDHISNWTEWEPSRWESCPLLSARNFHIFGPSFLSPE